MYLGMHVTTYSFPRSSFLWEWAGNETLLYDGWPNN